MAAGLLQLALDAGALLPDGLDLLSQQHVLGPAFLSGKVDQVALPAHLARTLGTALSHDTISSITDSACGGRESTTITVATSKLSPHQTGGGCGPLRCGPVATTTRPARAHDGLLDALTNWTDPEHVVLADLGYQSESIRLTCPIKKNGGAVLSVDQRTINALHSATRALAERGNSLLKTTFKTLHRVTFCPWRIGAITAAALVLLHHLHDRTT